MVTNDTCLSQGLEPTVINETCLLQDLELLAILYSANQPVNI